MQVYDNKYLTAHTYLSTYINMLNNFFVTWHKTKTELFIFSMKIVLLGCKRLRPRTNFQPNFSFMEDRGLKNELKCPYWIFNTKMKLETAEYYDNKGQWKNYNFRSVLI